MKKLFILLLVVSLFLLSYVTAAPPMPAPPSGWYYGDLHVHTGYSTKDGYDNNRDTTADNCDKESFSIFYNPNGYNISQLKQQASDNNGLDLDTIKYWFSITDHSYCLDTTEK